MQYVAAHLVNGDTGSNPVDAEHPAVLTEDHALSLVESTGKARLPHLSDIDQAELSTFVTSFGALERHRKALDASGLRYHVHLRLIHERQSSQRDQLSWRDIAWASHSNTQDVLVDLTSRLYNGRMLWEDAQQCGLFIWLSDQEALVRHTSTLPFLPPYPYSFHVELR